MFYAEDLNGIVNEPLGEVGECVTTPVEVIVVGRKPPTETQVHYKYLICKTPDNKALMIGYGNTSYRFIVGDKFTIAGKIRQIIEFDEDIDTVVTWVSKWEKVGL